MNMDIRFNLAGPWRSVYCRNNKIGGLKHIRCFPDHSPGGHRDIHYCGSSIEIEVRSRSFDKSRCVIIANFSLEVKPTFILGETVNKSMIHKSLQPETTRTSECCLFSSQLINTDSLNGVSTYLINSERKGWHYGWIAKKNIPGVKHTFNIYVLENSGVNSLQCVGLIRSPPFHVICRRRGVRKNPHPDLINLIETYCPTPRPLPVEAIDPFTMKPSITYHSLLAAMQERDPALSRLPPPLGLLFNPSFSCGAFKPWKCDNGRA